MVKQALSYRDPQRDRVSAVRLLGYGGLVPFWALIIFQFLESGLSEQASWDAEMAVILYGAIIVSFMAGGRWVFRLLDNDERQTEFFSGFFMAVLPALLAWMIVAAPDVIRGEMFTPLTRGFILGLILLFQLVQEFLHDRMLPIWYLNLRVQLTVGAVGGLWMSCLVAWAI